MTPHNPARAAAEEIAFEFAAHNVLGQTSIEAIIARHYAPYMQVMEEMAVALDRYCDVCMGAGEIYSLGRYETCCSCKGSGKRDHHALASYRALTQQPAERLIDEEGGQANGTH